MNFLHPGQTPNDTQPVHGLTKEIQWRFPEEFCLNPYFTVFGGLHFEQCILVIPGELIKGYGLYEILKNNGLSVIGTGAAFNANHVKQARYCLQVSLCAIYSKLKVPRVKVQFSLMLLDWSEAKIASVQMRNYWYLILTLQVHFLLHIRSIRESNFQFYISSIKNLME